VVEDDAVSRLVLGHMLRSLGWDVDEVADAPEAIAGVNGAGYDLVLCDYCLPSGTGMDVLDAVEAADVHPSFVLVTGKLDLSAFTPEITARVAAQLTKPVGTDALRATLDRLFPSISA
jgi:CheY-like chemotaxis protein